MRFRSDLDLLDRAGGRVEGINLAIEAAGQPELFSIGADIAHVGAAAAGDRPLRDHRAGCEVDDGYTTRPMRAGPVHLARATVGYEKPGSIPADGKTVGADAGRDETDF